MEDITKKIQNALSYDGNWKFSDFYLIIEILKSNRIDISFWENEENWATLINNSIAIGYLWKLYPILIIENDYINIINLKLQNYNFLNIISTKGLNIKNLRLNHDILKDYLEYGTIDCNNFSANDLWFSTNSI